MIDKAVLGWMAGILDFQGHVYKKSNPQRAEGSMQVTIMVDTKIGAIGQRMSELTGITPEPKEHKRLKDEWLRSGCAEHCPEAHIHVREVNYPQTTRWTVTGTACAIVLYNLLPYMTTDHEPWEWAMAQCLKQARLSGQGSAAVKVSAQRLHALGWRLPPKLRVFEPKALAS